MLSIKNEINNIIINFQKKKFDKAKSLTLSFINKNPNHPLGWKFLGAINTQLGNLPDAIIAHQNSIKYSPNDPEVYFNFAISLSMIGNLIESCRLYQQAIAINPNYIEALNNYGIILNKLKKFTTAKKVLLRSVSISPNYLNYLNLGNAFKGLGEVNDAIVSYKKAIFYNDKIYEAYLNLALIYSSMGRIDESIKFYEKTISMKPNHTDAHRLLSLLKKYKVKDPHFDKLNMLYQNKNLNLIERSHISFALAKYYEDIGNFEKSFNFYVEGNGSRKKDLNYNIQKDVKIFDQIKRTYYSYKNFQLDEEVNISPVFVLGLPRSGTTLIEQILSSHSKIYGAGELPFIGNLGHLIATNGHNSNSENLKNLKVNYTNRLKQISNNYQYITDKMPNNFLYIGLINTVFPKSKIIHVFRNKAATCWSIYKHYFTSNNLGYCYDLKDIVDYYRLYEDLMKFWSKEINENIILNLDYDRLTNNQHDEIKRLIKFLDLEWEDNCLKPELNKRIIDTASQLQIRKGIYQNSSSEWMKYKPFLNGILDEL